MAIITFSRQYGSGGSEIAAMVAESLGWSLLDNDVVDAVAERLGVSPQEITEREERVPSLVERLASALTLGAPEMLPPPDAAATPLTEERIVEVTRRVVEEAVARGPVVVVGRGAQAMLAEREDALHVFCYAPRAALVERAMQRLSVDRAEAERVVVETNNQRDQYVKRHWGRARQAFEYYHLCVNTSWLGLGDSARWIARLARERFPNA
jgi:cytidylate kinase